MSALQAAENARHCRPPVLADWAAEGKGQGLSGREGGQQDGGRGKAAGKGRGWGVVLAGRAVGGAREPNSRWRGGATVKKETSRGFTDGFLAHWILRTKESVYYLHIKAG